MTTMKAVIIKRSKYGPTVTVSRSGCPSKIDEKTRRKLSRKAANSNIKRAAGVSGKYYMWQQSSLFFICPGCWLRWQSFHIKKKQPSLATLCKKHTSELSQKH